MAFFTLKNSSTGPKNCRAFPPAILCVLTLASYIQVLSCGFIEAYDDEPYVTRNPVVVQGITWEGLRWSLSSFTAGNWHPLTWWSHMLDVQLFGMNPSLHHATSLVMHTVIALLLYLFFSRTTGMRGRSFLVSALFSLHPLHVESVAWIAERKDVLSSLFGLGAMHAYVSYTHSHQRRHYLLLLILFCLSLMAKPMLVTLPFLLLVLDFWPLKRMQQTSPYILIREKLPMLLPVVAVSVVTVIAQNLAGALIPLAGNPLSTRLAVALNAYIVYLRKFFAPYDLAVYYPYAAVPVGRAVVAITILFLITAVVWQLRRSSHFLLTGWLWFLGTLIPAIGIIRVGTQPYADRYTYLPIIGVIIMVIWGGGELLEGTNLRKRAAVPIATAALLVCCALTWLQTGYWRDGHTLYSRSLAVTKGNWLAHIGLGNILVNRQRYREGISHYYAALADEPLSVEAHHNLGIVYNKIGDAHLSQKHFRTAIQLRPDSEENYLALAHSFANSGNLESSMNVIREGLQNIPASPSLYANEALLLQRMGHIKEAVVSYNQALDLDPEFLSVYSALGELLAQNGRMTELEQLLNRLSRIDPDEAQKLSKTLFNSNLQPK